MGLDITAYKKLEIIENPKYDEDGELDYKKAWQPGESMEWSEKHFPGRGEGIDSKAVYQWEEALRFPAGSYSGYNDWRRKLAEFKGDVAFQELIDFADNEGVIGYVVAKKLAKDFADYEEEARVYASNWGVYGNYWFNLYKEWREAFEMAADHGAVDFH